MSRLIVGDEVYTELHANRTYQNQGLKMTATLQEMLEEWNNPYGARNVPDAEDLITELQIELAGKEAVIKALISDINYYSKKLAENENG